MQVRWGARAGDGCCLQSRTRTVEIAEARSVGLNFPPLAAAHQITLGQSEKGMVTSFGFQRATRWKDRRIAAIARVRGAKLAT